MKAVIVSFKDINKFNFVANVIEKDEEFSILVINHDTLTMEILVSGEMKNFVTGKEI